LRSKFNIQIPGKELGQFIILPDKVPFLQLGGHEPEMSDAVYPLDFLHRLPSTAKDNVRYDDNAPPSEHLFENPLTVHISIQSVET
jgi:hypothetical protein